MSRFVSCIAATIALIPIINGGCDPNTIAPELAPGITGEQNIFAPGTSEPTIRVDPADLDIGSNDYAYLQASTSNVPRRAAIVTESTIRD